VNFSPSLYERDSISLESVLFFKKKKKKKKKVNLFSFHERFRI
jgi:hypothetical protein